MRKEIVIMIFGLILGMGFSFAWKFGWEPIVIVPMTTWLFTLYFKRQEEAEINCVLDEVEKNIKTVAQPPKEAGYEDENRTVYISEIKKIIQKHKV